MGTRRRRPWEDHRRAPLTVSFSLCYLGTLLYSACRDRGVHVKPHAAYPVVQKLPMKAEAEPASLLSRAPHKLDIHAPRGGASRSQLSLGPGRQTQCGTHTIRSHLPTHSLRRIEHSGLANRLRDCALCVVDPRALGWFAERRRCGYCGHGMGTTT
ncbi:hypothetical protein BJ912DRAFT_961825 [Pholiota molesta]|nr:hypothetical protein BJ912DRAFT_961825 [Pholiota molesta]